MNRIARVVKQEAARVCGAFALATFSTVGQDWVAEVTGGVTALVLFPWLLVAMV